MRISLFQVSTVVMLLVALVSTGCDQGADSGASDMENLANQIDQSNQAKAAADAAAAAAQAKAAEDARRAEEAARQAAAAAEQPAPEPENETTITITVKNPQGLLVSPEAKEAMAGIVGQKQRKNRVEGPLQYYGAMANARIIAMDRALGWQITESLKLWSAEHDGKFPKTTEEFMKQIVEPNLIELPELEPNQEYYFDPEQHELVILERIEEPAETVAPAAN